jgi:uncharacterized protein YuzE
MGKNNFEYNSDEDILYLYGTDSPVDVNGSIVLNNLIVDLSSSGTVIGLQIENASSFLNIPGELLDSIKSAELRVLRQSNTVLIGWKIQAGKNNQIIMNNLVLPTNKVLLTH